MRGSRFPAGLVVLLAGVGWVTVHGGRSTGARGGMAPPVLRAGLVAYASPAPVHDLHETYADLAIEGRVIGGRVRFYRKDLERALGPMLESDAVSLSPGAEADALVLRYLGEHLTLVAGGDTLAATLLQGEAVEMGHHPGWQVTLSWEAAGPVAEVHVRNTLLLEIHDDQRNVMRFVRFPEETRVTLTTEAGAEEGTVG